MSTLFEITGDDIALLDDAELRTLIGLLCEADYRQAGLPITGITWGGNQDARDGGLDVSVRGNITPPPNSFIPRGTTGFQVKKPDMPPQKIADEMRPDGVLREVIKELIQQNGAYVIVSSKASTTHSALNNRNKAMREAVKDQPDHLNLQLNFLDRGLIAAWVRNHPSLILRVRHKIGRPLKGWHAYENWAKSPGGTEEEYLLDEGLRLHDRTTSGSEGMAVQDGLAKLQALLTAPGGCVRLAGLSGVGKTRLVQALFDPRVNQASLNPTEVFYTDMSEGPVPDPAGMAEQLIAGRTRAILIVDNCPPELHNQLARVCSGAHSTISLLTVEYDVRDDLPNETSAFRLEPASEEIIKKLIGKRFSHIAQVDAQTIAKFSGGNARLAIALANTVQTGETLSSFRDEELFERLFWQRNNQDDGLLMSAEVCSLLYSFEGADVISESSELKLLATLASKTVADLYRNVATLKSRDLLQTRSVWRAILPHAVANRLARRAFGSIPKEILVQTILNSGSERLVKSFTRRMSYLHDCEMVVEIANDWLASDGWIGKDIGNLSSFEMDVLSNIAPVSPKKTLEAIERAADQSETFASSENSNYEEFGELLRQLAYDPALFTRCIDLLCKLAVSEQEQNKDSISERIKSLFYIYLSGTKAPLETRAHVVEALINSIDPIRKKLGFRCLDSALEAWHFSSSYDFGFGAWPRDYGYQPETQEDVVRWYGAFIDICVRASSQNSPASERAREVLAKNFRGLWTRGGIFELLERASLKILSHKPWSDGWIAVRGIICYDSKHFSEEILKKIRALENLLKPNNLLEQARTFAFSDQSGGLYLEDGMGDEDDPITGWERTEKTTRKIGALVAQDTQTFNVILPDLVSTDGRRLLSFGQGLADGFSDHEAAWNLLKEQLRATEPEKRELGVLGGFLSTCAEINPEFYNSVMDRMVKDDLLAEWYPRFQTSKTDNPRCIARLHESLDFGKAPASAYQYLAWGRAHEPISDDDMAALLEKIILKEGGRNAAIEILTMRFHGKDKSFARQSQSLVSVAHKVLLTVTFSRADGTRNDGGYRLADFAEMFLLGPGGEPAAEALCKNLAQAITSGAAYAFDYTLLLQSLASVQPTVFLNVFLGLSDENSYRLQRIFLSDYERRENPLNQISDSDIINWCEASPAERYPIVAGWIDGFSSSDDQNTLKWKPIVHTLFERAPSLDEILDALGESIRPSGWSGSLADILQARVVLFESLFDHENSQISAWAGKFCDRLKESIRNQREIEENRNRDRNESFE